MTYRLLPLLAAPLALAACAPATPAPGPVPPPNGLCSTTGLERYYGQVATQENGSAMWRESGAKTFRWLTPNMMITMEFRGDRLNVRLGTDNRIGSAYCG